MAAPLKRPPSWLLTQVWLVLGPKKKMILCLVHTRQRGLILRVFWWRVRFAFTNKCNYWWTHHSANPDDFNTVNSHAIRRTEIMVNLGPAEFLPWPFSGLCRHQGQREQRGGGSVRGPVERGQHLLLPRPIEPQSRLTFRLWGKIQVRLDKFGIFKR